MRRITSSTRSRGRPGSDTTSRTTDRTTGRFLRDLLSDAPRISSETQICKPWHIRCLHFTLESLTMKCVWGHKHPPDRVVVLISEGPTIRMPVRRVYHCGSCTVLALMAGTFESEEFQTPLNARRAGHHTACPVCLPSRTAQSRGIAHADWLVVCTCGWQEVSSSFQTARANALRHEGRTSRTANRLAQHSCKLSRMPRGPDM
jgi:hypothetical protein